METTTLVKVPVIGGFEIRTEIKSDVFKGVQLGSLVRTDEKIAEECVDHIEKDLGDVLRFSQGDLPKNKIAYLVWAVDRSGIKTVRRVGYGTGLSKS